MDDFTRGPIATMFTLVNATYRGSVFCLFCFGSAQVPSIAGCGVVFQEGGPHRKICTSTENTSKYVFCRAGVVL